MIEDWQWSCIFIIAIVLGSLFGLAMSNYAIQSEEFVLGELGEEFVLKENVGDCIVREYVFPEDFNVIEWCAKKTCRSVGDGKDKYGNQRLYVSTCAIGVGFD